MRASEIPETDSGRAKEFPETELWAGGVRFRRRTPGGRRILRRRTPEQVRTSEILRSRTPGGRRILRRRTPGGRVRFSGDGLRVGEGFSGDRAPGGRSEIPETGLRAGGRVYRSRTPGEGAGISQDQVPGSSTGAPPDTSDLTRGDYGRRGGQGWFSPSGERFSRPGGWSARCRFEAADRVEWDEEEEGGVENTGLGVIADIVGGPNPVVPSSESGQDPSHSTSHRRLSNFGGLLFVRVFLGLYFPRRTV